MRLAFHDVKQRTGVPHPFQGVSAGSEAARSAPRHGPARPGSVSWIVQLFCSPVSTSKKPLRS